MLVLLPRLGYQRTFPHAIIFGPKFAGGIGCPHFSAVQLSKKASSIIKHVHAGTKIGKKFEVLIQWAQLCAGTTIPFLEDHCRLPYLEGKWLNQLRDGQWGINTKLHLAKPWIPPATTTE
eukprot:8000113-Ditylum_brightwellii.AAC.1